MKKIISLLIVTALSVATLTGCGSADTLKLVDTMCKTIQYEGVTETGTAELEINKEELKKNLIIAINQDVKSNSSNDTDTDKVENSVDVNEEINKIMDRVPEKVKVNYTVNWPNYEKLEADFDLDVMYGKMNIEMAGYVTPEYVAIELDTIKSLLDALVKSESKLLDDVTVPINSINDAIKSLKDDGQKYIKFESSIVDPQEFSDTIRSIKSGELETKIKEEIAKIKDADASEIISSKNGVINLHGNGCSLAKVCNNILTAIRDSEIVGDILDEQYITIDGTYVDRTDEDMLINTANGEVRLTLGTAVLRGDVENLSKGDRVIAIVSNAYTMSIPPITNAQLVYAGDNMLLADMVVSSKEKVDGKYKVESSCGKYVFYADSSLKVSDRKNKMIMNIEDIKPMDRLFVLYDNATKSIPSQLSVVEVIRAREYVDIPMDRTTKNYHNDIDFSSDINNSMDYIEYNPYSEEQYILKIFEDADIEKMVSYLEMTKESAEILADALKNSTFDIDIKEENGSIITDTDIKVNVNKKDLFKFKCTETVKECDSSYCVRDSAEYDLIEPEIFEARCAKYVARQDKLKTLNIYWNTMIPVYGNDGTYVRNPGPEEGFDCRIKTTHASGEEYTYYGKAFLREDRIYLPMRQIIECSGLDVEWDGKTAYAVKADGTKAELTGFIENGRTYVKVRDFEKVGVKIDYAGGSNLDGVESENRATLEFN